METTKSEMNMALKAFDVATIEDPLFGSGHKVMQNQLSPDTSASAATAESEVTFLQDFVAGGVAGCISIAVGHPFDTIKVRMQTTSSKGSLLSNFSSYGGISSSASTQRTCALGGTLIIAVQVRMQTTSSKGSLLSNFSSYGGISSLFRGMGPPLSSAAVINAVIFATYGQSARLYDDALSAGYFGTSNVAKDPIVKAVCCGGLTGFMQSVIVGPMEHIKCRLQIQHGKGTPDNVYRSPSDAVRSILRTHGVRGLLRGWWITCVREVPGFGVYFGCYDYCKTKITDHLSKQSANNQSSFSLSPSTHGLLAATVSGGIAGIATWALTYPADIIKTRIQTTSLDAQPRDLQMIRVGWQMVAENGWRSLFRGLSVTLVRALPVNAVVFPVYEICLMQIAQREY
eukprot:CAMPEP_0198134826 /NCGR_PEP_ID=MMETSP1442-20131203/60275_1 /TAXON_ID= /ORGANISM="Craspedostauros australis, Strain CCMP3328" /LENGTH=399 /DNA_ID=CAMNT_0043795979 /DNA_START=103 /DNA_END=1302 /DNA_ORIENTATION=-